MFAAHLSGIHPENAPPGPSLAWLPSIFSRQSRRRFDGCPPAPSDLAELEATAARFQPWRTARGPVARVALTALDTPAGRGVFTGLAGSYGKIRGATHALLVIHDPTQKERDPWAAAGYTGQALILEATRLGFGTCWVTGTFRPETAAALTPLAPHERIAGISPVGYPLGSRTVAEHAFSVLLGSRKRLPFPILAPGHPEANWPEWACRAVEAARLAPSARNRQPWRFSWDGTSLVVCMDPEALAADTPGAEAADAKCRLDCGIAMLHLELAALNDNVVGVWEELPSPCVARFRPINGVFKNAA